MKKTCSYCEIEKEIDMFRKIKETRTKEISFYYCSLCKECERIKALDRYNKNRDSCIEANKNYKKQNIDKINLHRREYTRKLMSNPIERLKRNLKCSLAGRIKNKKYLSGSYLGTDISTIKHWIEFNMVEDMSWDNYGSVWQIDHTIPIGIIDMNNQEDVNLVFSWMNLMPLYKKVNSKKSNNLHHIRIFYQESRLKLYSKQNTELEGTIINYIERYTEKYKSLLLLND